MDRELGELSNMGFDRNDPASRKAIESAKKELKDQQGWAWSYAIFGLLFLASVIGLSITRVDLPSRVWSLVCSPAELTIKQIGSGNHPYQINWIITEYSKAGPSDPKYSSEGNYVGAYFTLTSASESNDMRSGKIFVFRRGTPCETAAFGELLESGMPFLGHFYMPKSTGTGEIYVIAESHVNLTIFFLCIVFLGLAFFSGAAFYNYHFARKTIAKLSRLQGSQIPNPMDEKAIFDSSTIQLDQANC